MFPPSLRTQSPYWAPPAARPSHSPPPLRGHSSDLHVAGGLAAAQPVAGFPADWAYEGVARRRTVMNDSGVTRVAVYVDFDNIVISRYDQVHGRGQFLRDKARGFSRADGSADPD